MTAEPIPDDDSTTVGAFEAKTHLSALLARAEAGEVITITKHGRPVARLVPTNVQPGRRFTPEYWKALDERTKEMRARLPKETPEERKAIISEGRL